MALLLLITSSVMFAQVPDAMTFQSVIRNAQGDLATNKNITLRLSILQGSATGVAVYVENQSGKTNANGLISLNLGRGTAVSGSFNDIDWSNGPYFLQVAVDVEGGFNFVNQTTTQLLSVPYALYALKAETVSGTISYNKLVDVPDNIGFSGNYEDLSGKPAFALVATSGQYTDLQGTPALADVATSGNYSDLQGTPVLANVATSGAYADLSGKPNLATVATSGAYTDLQGTPELKRVAMTGSYNDLTDKPILSQTGTFSGSYLDLTNRPNIKDSVAQYGFDGLYNSLNGIPSFANVAFSGDYNDLVNRPTSMGGSGVSDYNDLSNLPNLKDTVQKYMAGATGDYQALINKPNFADSVAAYEHNDYVLLQNRPNIHDSVKAYGFSGEYYELNHRPNIVDSIALYGFSGSWKDLKDMPAANATGTIMYYDASIEAWRTLVPGNAGDILMIGKDGRPQWVNASFVAQNIANVDLIEVQILNYPSSQYTVEESTGLMSNTGKLLVPMYQDVAYEFHPKEGVGVKQILINGVDVDSAYYTEHGITFLEFNADTTGTGHSSFKLTVKLESEKVTYITRVEVAADSFACDTSRMSVGYMCDFTLPIKQIDSLGLGLYSVEAGGKNITAKARQLNTIIVDSIVSDTTIIITYKQDLFSIGDVYKEGGKSIGVVYEVAPGGKQAKVVNIAQATSHELFAWSTTTEEVGAKNADGADNQALVSGKWALYPAFNAAHQLGEGWYLPSAEEAETIYQTQNIINSVLQTEGTTGKTLENALIWTSNEEAEEYASSYDMEDGYVSGVQKKEEHIVVSIKQVSK